LKCGEVGQFREIVAGASYDNHYLQNEDGEVFMSREQHGFDAADITFECDNCHADMSDMEVKAQMKR